jgi:toprim domain protein
MDDGILIIVEGKNDQRRLRRLLPDSIDIAMTYGIPTETRLASLRRQAAARRVYIFTDADATGRRIRGILGDTFPEADHLYTKASYKGVEATPLDYLAERLEAAGLTPTYDADELFWETNARSERRTRSARAMRAAPR